MVGLVLLLEGFELFDALVDLVLGDTHRFHHASHHLHHVVGTVTMRTETVRTMAVGTMAVGTVTVGAVAVGAVAVGTMAVGAVTVGTTRTVRSMLGLELIKLFKSFHDLTLVATKLLHEFGHHLFLLTFTTRSPFRAATFEAIVLHVLILEGLELLKTAVDLSLGEALGLEHVSHHSLHVLGATVRAVTTRAMLGLELIKLFQSFTDLGFGAAILLQEFGHHLFLLLFATRSPFRAATFEAIVLLVLLLVGLELVIDAVELSLSVALRLEDVSDDLHHVFGALSVTVRTVTVRAVTAGAMTMRTVSVGSECLEGILDQLGEIVIQVVTLLLFGSVFIEYGDHHSGCVLLSSDLEHRMRLGNALLALGAEIVVLAHGALIAHASNWVDAAAVALNVVVDLLRAGLIRRELVSGEDLLEDLARLALHLLLHERLESLAGDAVLLARGGLGGGWRGIRRRLLKDERLSQLLVVLDNRGGHGLSLALGSLVLLKVNAELESHGGTDGGGVGNVEVILLEEGNLVAGGVVVGELKVALGGHVVFVAKLASHELEVSEGVNALGKLLDGEVVVLLEDKLDVEGTELLDGRVLHLWSKAFVFLNRAG